MKVATERYETIRRPGMQSTPDHYYYLGMGQPIMYMIDGYDNMVITQAVQFLCCPPYNFTEFEAQQYLRLLPRGI